MMAFLLQLSQLLTYRLSARDAGSARLSVQGLFLLRAVLAMLAKWLGLLWLTARLKEYALNPGKSGL